MSENLYGPLPKEANKGWTVKVNGEEIPHARHVEIGNPSFGKLVYGAHPSGKYDTWGFEQTNHGGATTLPFFRDENNDLYVGLVKESRYNMGKDDVLCVSGGFVEPSESFKDTAKRELEEESGLRMGEPMELGGLPWNSNRAFFFSNPYEGEGDRHFALEIPLSLVQKTETGYRLNETADIPVNKKDLLVFLKWDVAVNETADMFAGSAIAQLMAHLCQQGISFK